MQKNGKIEQMVLQVKTAEILSNQAGSWLPFLQPRKLGNEEKVIRKMNVRVY